MPFYNLNQIDFGIVLKLDLFLKICDIILVLFMYLTIYKILINIKSITDNNIKRRNIF